VSHDPFTRGHSIVIIEEVNKEDTMVFDSVDLLVQVYEDYVTKQGLPYVSADEQDKSELTIEQVRWIESFENLWDLAT